MMGWKITAALAVVFLFPNHILSNDVGRAEIVGRLAIPGIGTNTIKDTDNDTAVPSIEPSMMPTTIDEFVNNGNDTAVPSTEPTIVPTTIDQFVNNGNDTAVPSIEPSIMPTTIDQYVNASGNSSDDSSYPTSFPTIYLDTDAHNETSANATLWPTSMPTLAIDNTTVPTSQPTWNDTLMFLPTSQPTSQPSVDNSSTEYPTSQPTAQPTTNGTSYPTSQPTGQPSQAPTGPTQSPTTGPTAPTGQPSGQPSSEPTGQPTVGPSAQPSVQPINSPTAAPSLQPSSQPTSTPSSIPSSPPSAVPTSMPSPAGSMGESWWYMVSAETQLDMDPSDAKKHSDEQVIPAVEYAFTFVLTDQMTETQRSSVEVGATTDSSRRRSLKTNVVTQAASEGDDSKRMYVVKAWCPDHATLAIVRQAMVFAELHPVAIKEPLHEQGIYEVVNVTITNELVYVSSELPPSTTEESSKLSPVRITYIILGTLLLFSLGLCLISNFKNFKYCFGRLCTHECKICMEDTCRSMYHTTADCIMLCMHVTGFTRRPNFNRYYGSSGATSGGGFEFTTAGGDDEEGDFYGERYNLPSDNLNIHYGGRNNQRSQYLADDDDDPKFSNNGYNYNRRSVEMMNYVSSNNRMHNNSTQNPMIGHHSSNINNSIRNTNSNSNSSNNLVGIHHDNRNQLTNNSVDTSGDTAGIGRSAANPVHARVDDFLN